MTSASLYTIVGGFLALLGLAVTVLFWMPKLLDRGKLREIMGPRYPLIYVIYIANGPLLLFFGLALLFWLGSS